ncbi:unnamed protein product [Choristocarpus tenellus]
MTMAVGTTTPRASLKILRGIARGVARNLNRRSCLVEGTATATRELFSGSSVQKTSVSQPSSSMQPLSMDSVELLPPFKPVSTTPVISKRPDFNTDLLVLGCGVAGASAALKAAKAGMHVTMLSSSADTSDCNSYWAQGGIIYRSEDDTPELLASDVHAAGAGICDHQAVMKLAVDGPSRVEELLLKGPATVPFDRNMEGELALCLEASHSRPRILHWQDQTGKAITESVQAAAIAHPNIHVVTSATAVDLALSLSSFARFNTHDYNTGQETVQCVGAHVLIEDPKSGRNSSSLDKTTRIETILAPATVLATGGLGDLYAHTSNPASSRGAGFAIALRAGAELSNMEYVQFHPTTLFIPERVGERSFLLTEALRGEGARLVDAHGREFAKDYHPNGEVRLKRECGGGFFGGFEGLVVRVVICRCSEVLGREMSGLWCHR